MQTRLTQISSTAAILAVFLLLPAPGGGAQAASSRIIYSHAGANDPLSEGGWTQGGGSTTRDGLDAWLVDDRSTAHDDWYEQTIPDIHIVGAAVEGWTLFIDLAVQDIPDTADGAIHVLYSNGVDQFELQFTIDPAEGSTRLVLGGTASPTTVDIPGSRHVYSVRYDVFAGSASVNIDGVTSITDWLGEPGLTFRGVRFGSAGLIDTGSGAYQVVEWSPLTEEQYHVTHSGSVDPITEGWTRMATNSGALVGPMQAWRVEDLSTASGSTGAYLGTPEPATFDKGLGWTLRSRLTVADIANTPDVSIQLGHDTSSSRFYLAFGEDANRNPTVVLWDGTFSSGVAQGAAITIPGSGEHLYELVYDAIAGKADLFIDGAVALTDYTGVTPPLGSTRVLWGSGHSAGRGEGWYSLVEFEVVTCPDGIIDPNEACDDNNGIAGDGCSAECELEPGATCSGSPSICEICGNGMAEGDEECDDENMDPGDGCSPSCREEPGWVCAGLPSICSFCGDGVVEGIEECDDGGTVPGDGCYDICTIETGWSCSSSPSICVLCGDGLVEGIEECDDGGTVPRDGCSGACEQEIGWDCSGEPSVCETTCGDGALASAEANAFSTMLISDDAGLKLLDLDTDQATVLYWSADINDIELTDDRSLAYMATGSGELLRFDFATATVTTLLSNRGNLQRIAIVSNGDGAYLLEDSTRILMIDLTTPPHQWFEMYQSTAGSLSGLAGHRPGIVGFTMQSVGGARTLIELPYGDDTSQLMDPYTGPTIGIVVGANEHYPWAMGQSADLTTNIEHAFPFLQPFPPFTFPSNGEGFDLAINGSTYEMFLSEDGGIRSSFDLFQDVPGTMRSSFPAASITVPSPGGCDDGNLQDGDGCSSACELESILEFCGVAEGGSVDLVVNGIPVSYATTAGETGDSIAQGLFTLMSADPNITNLNDFPWTDGNRLIFDGEFNSSSINDPGLGSCVPQPLPMIHSIEPLGGNLYTIAFDPVAGAVGYNLYAGTLEDWYDHGSGSDNRCNLTFTALSNGMNEATVYLGVDNTYILISSHNGVSEGPAGVTSEGLEVDPAQSTCPP